MPRRTRWSDEKAKEWYQTTPWLRGFNYLPVNAVNTSEMWSEETFDITIVEHELGWAAGLGLNTCRVFTQFLIWEQDPQKMLHRMDQFLETAAQHGISTMFTLFDDCAFDRKEPYLGKQDEPILGVHNSRWTPSPGYRRVTDQTEWSSLEEYISSVIMRFANDHRVAAWDLYNEPGPGDKETSLPLLISSFTWARAADPQQPITVGVWNEDLTEINQACLEQSDIVSFHQYGRLEAVQASVARLRQTGRPLICTEWMARTVGSLWQTHFPYWKKERIGCYSWGLVNGRTQTHFAWRSQPGNPEPKIWHHDLFLSNGLPYSQEEADFIRKLAQI